MAKYSSWIRFFADEQVQDFKIRKAAVEPSFAEKEKGEFIDWGLPIPDRYNSTYLRLLVQDPYRLFCYWELAPDVIDRFFSERDSKNHLALRLHNLTDSVSTPVLVGKEEAWWLHVSADKEYRTSLEVCYPDGSRMAIVNSNSVKTPPDTMSWDIEPFDLFKKENTAYLRLLTFSGAEILDKDFIEMLSRCSVYEDVFIVPEFLLKYLPSWLRKIIRKLDFKLPISIFIEFILKRYFPEQLHQLILNNPNLTIEEFEKYLKDHEFSGVSSLHFYSDRNTDLKRNSKDE